MTLRLLSIYSANSAYAMTFTVVTARHGNAALCAGCHFLLDGSRRHRTGRGSGQNRRRCSRAESRCETVRPPGPATSCRSMRTGSYHIAPGEEDGQESVSRQEQRHQLPRSVRGRAIYRYRGTVCSANRKGP